MEMELGFNKHIASRAVYNVFDYISDIGGLQGALDSIFCIIMGFWAPAMTGRSLLRNFKYDSNSGDGGEGGDGSRKKNSVSVEDKQVSAKAAKLA